WGLRTVGYEVQDDRNRRSEQFHDLIEGVFALLTARGENAEQNLLGVGAVFGTVATPRLSCNHSRAQGAFGRIVSCVDTGTVEKGKKPGLFATQMFGQTPIGGIVKRLGQQSLHAGGEAPRGHMQ